MSVFNVEIIEEVVSTVEVEAPDANAARHLGVLMRMEGRDTDRQAIVCREAIASRAAVGSTPAATLCELLARNLTAGAVYAPADADLEDEEAWSIVERVEVADDSVAVHNAGPGEVLPAWFDHDGTVYTRTYAPTVAAETVTPEPAPVTDDELLAAHQAHQDAALRLGDLYYRRVTDLVRAAYPNAAILVTYGPRKASGELDVRAYGVVDGDGRFVGATYAACRHTGATDLAHLTAAEIIKFENATRDLNKALHMLAAYTDDEYEGWQNVDL